MIFRNATLLTAARFAGDGLGFLFFIILSRRLGPEGIGQYALGMATALLVYSWVIFGMDDLSIRDCARLGSRERVTFLGQLLGLQLVLAAVVVVLFAGLLVFDWPARATITVCLILSGYYGALGFAQMLFTPAFAQQQIMFQSLAEVSTRAGATVSAILLVLFTGVSLPVALLPFSLAGLILVGCGLNSARRYNGRSGLSLSWQQVKTTARLAWPFGAVAILFTLQTRVSYIVLGAMSGEGATGIYASGIKFVETGVLPLAYLAMAAFPSLSRAQSENAERLNWIAGRQFRVSLAGGALLAWFLVFVLPDLIVPLFGPKFSLTQPLLPPLALLALILGAEIPVNRVLIASGLQGLVVKFLAWGVLANASLALLLVPVAGIYGAVAGTIGGQIIITALSLRTVHKRGVKLCAVKYLAAYLISLAACVLAGKAAQHIWGHAWVGAAGALAAMSLVWVTSGFVSLSQIFSARYKWNQAPLNNDSTPAGQTAGAREKAADRPGLLSDSQCKP